MAETRNELLKQELDEYLYGIDLDNIPAPSQVKYELLERVNKEITFRNSVAPKDNKWRKLQNLNPPMIARVLLASHNVRRVLWEGAEKGSNDVLMIYQDRGADEGIYVADEISFGRIISLYHYTVTSNEIKETMRILREHAPLCKVNSNPDLIAVNNGIFDYKNKQLLPFSPNIIFTSKSSVNYNENATINPIIHNDEDGSDWNVESWMESLSDNPEIVNLLWQVTGAVIRNNVPWDKVICLYSEQGNNGKGTLCSLLRNLCGEGNSAALPFEKFSQEFQLEALTRVSAVIADENDTVAYTKQAGNLKAVITGDSILINRKNRMPISLIFRGLMVQCVNALPKIGDKSESLYRRFLMIPFEKCFTGQERKYIKQDYLKRTEVLEYVMRKVLHISYYSFNEPKACQELLQEYKEYNDPIRQFLDEIMPKLAWDIVPHEFLYALFNAWHKINVPSGIIVGRNTFLRDVRNILADSTEWEERRGTAVRVGSMMDAPELLIMEYDLKKWMNPAYNGHSIECRYHPVIPEFARGWKRI